MNVFRIVLCALLIPLVTAAGFAREIGPRDGRELFETLFNPDLYFSDEITDNTDEELLLAVRTSARDDYLPSYALAIAVLSEPGEAEGTYNLTYRARMLEVPTDDDGNDFDGALTTTALFQDAVTPKERQDAFRKSRLRWVEADLWQCEGAIAAFDAVRAADWNPDWHYTRLKPEARQIVLHPAMTWITMRGDIREVNFRGWRNAAGVAAAANRLRGVLEPCWANSTGKQPWRYAANAK